MEHNSKLYDQGGITVRYCDEDASTCIGCAKIALADAFAENGRLRALLADTLPFIDDAYDGERTLIALAADIRAAIAAKKDGPK